MLFLRRWLNYIDGNNNNWQLFLTDGGSVIRVTRGCTDDVPLKECYPESDRLVCEYYCSQDLCNNSTVTVIPDPVVVTTAVTPDQTTAMSAASISKIAVLPLFMLMLVARLWNPWNRQTKYMILPPIGSVWHMTGSSPSFSCHFNLRLYDHILHNSMIM